MTYEEMRKALDAIATTARDDGEHKEYITVNECGDGIAITMDGIFTTEQLRKIADLVDQYEKGLAR